MQATIVVAFDKNFGIGLDGKLPWSIPEDLDLFKNRTTGEAVIMGRKTYDSLPKNSKPLKGRKNIVLSRSTKPTTAEECFGRELVFVPSPSLAIQVAQNENLHPYVIGGEQIYKLFLQKKLIDDVYASEVKQEYDADTWFPIKFLKTDGWDREELIDYQDFKLVRYATCTKIRQERDAAREEISKLKKSNQSLGILLANYQRESVKKYRYETDYLPYDDRED